MNKTQEPVVPSLEQRKPWRRCRRLGVYAITGVNLSHSYSRGQLMRNLLRHKNVDLIAGRLQGPSTATEGFSR